MSTRACKFCGGRIRFVTVESGRAMPVNLDPDPAGNVVMEEGIARVLTAEQRRHWTGPRLMPHTATCTHRPRRR
jgi:hypothetical protein